MSKKKSKLDTLNQVHGKVEKPITLDQIWGDDGKNKYGTLDINEYDIYLDSLGKSDMQAHAIKVGLVPVDDRSTLVKRLKQEFKKYASQFQPRPQINNGNKLSKEARDILAEGR